MHVTERGLIKGQSLASLYFFLLGFGSLLPYGTVISTLDFFDERYPSGHVTFTFPLASFISNAILIFLMVYIKKRIHLKFRIPISIFITTLLLIGMPIVSFLLPRSTLGLTILWAFQFISGGFNTIFNASVVGLAGHFPPQYMVNNSTGTSISGLLSNLIRLVLLLIFPYEASQASMVYEIVAYYTVAAIILLSCIYLHYKFINSEIAAYYLPPENLPESNRPTIISDERSDSRVYLIMDANNQPVVVVRNAWENTKDNFKELWRVFKSVKGLFLIMTLNHIETYMLIPGVMLKKPIGFMDPAWKIVAFFTVFNFFDATGKALTGIKRLVSQKSLCFVVCVRVIFYFTFLVQATTLNFPVIDQDWFAFVNIMLFALCGGFVTSGVFVLCPQEVDRNDKETAGFLALQSLLIGMAIGSACALPFRRLTPS